MEEAWPFRDTFVDIRALPAFDGGIPDVVDASSHRGRGTLLLGSSRGIVVGGVDFDSGGFRRVMILHRWLRRRFLLGLVVVGVVAWVDRGQWGRDKVDAFVGSLVLASFLKKVSEAVYMLDVNQLCHLCGVKKKQ